jgi:hypothetical protein
VLHARTRFVVCCQRLPDGARVELSDGSLRVPHRKQVDAASVTGRGLMILDTLARRWGVEPHAEGKMVWFELGCAT